MRRGTSSLTFKLFAVCLSFVLICVFIISSLSSQFVKDQVIGRDQEFISQILSKVNEYLSLNFSAMQTILFSVDSLIESNGYEEKQVGRYLDSLFEMNIQYVSNIYVIKEDLSIVGGRMITRVLDQRLPELEDIYKNAINSSYSTSISSPYRSKFSGWTVTISRVSKTEPSLVIAVDINIVELEKKLLQIHREEQIKLFIVDYNGSILANSVGGIGTVGKQTHIGSISIEEIMNRDSDMFIYPDSRVETLVMKLHSPKYNWQLIAISDGARLAHILNTIDSHFYFLISIGLLLSLITAMLITRYIRRPVLQLIKKMRQVEQGDLDIQVTLDRNDEFGDLSRTFDSMLHQIDDLFNRLTMNKELQKKLEIAVLQAQINPHFLYNTLGAISNVVRLGQTDKVDIVIRSLIAILEYGVKDPSYKVPLHDELQNVRDYIIIQNIRYNREFDLVLNIDPRLLEFEVFRMFLQPIVENSIFHGYKGGQIQGVVRIDAYCEDRKVVIEVTDQGIGISEDKVIDLFKHREESSGINQRNRIGLANINGRIKLHYGEAYGLSISGEQHKGTCVRAELPVPHEGSISI